VPVRSEANSGYPLAVDDPFGLAQWREIGGEGAALGEVGVIGEEPQAAGGMKGGELFQDQPVDSKFSLW
jgi:hypothetical protein